MLSCLKTTVRQGNQEELRPKRAPVSGGRLKNKEIDGSDLESNGKARD